MICAQIDERNGMRREWFPYYDHEGIYKYMMEITDGDHEISDDASSWCEIASIGETYEFREGTIEMVDDDDVE